MKDLLIGTLTRLGGPGICYVRTDGEHLTQLWTDGTLTDPNWQDVSPDGRIFSVSCDGPEPMDGCIHELTITPEGMKVLSTRSTGVTSTCEPSGSRLNTVEKRRTMAGRPIGVPM